MGSADEVQFATLNRRAFLYRGTLVIAGSLVATPVAALGAFVEKPKLRIGLATDLHYADKPPAGGRHYRETLDKLAEAAARFTEEAVDAVVELGDLIDSAPSLDVEKGNLRRVVKEFAAIRAECHYVLGNHCVAALTKPEFLEIVGREQSYKSFDLKGYHFVVLDACFRSDSEPYGRNNFDWTDALIPSAEVDWLRADLAQTPHKAVVFVHQRLDVGPPYGVKNAQEIRRILERSGKVLAVVQGHDHKGAFQEIAGIPYCTLKAMVEGSGKSNSAYAVMDILPGDHLRIRGFRRQMGHE